MMFQIKYHPLQTFIHWQNRKKEKKSFRPCPLCTELFHENYIETHVNDCLTKRVNLTCPLCSTFFEIEKQLFSHIDTCYDTYKIKNEDDNDKLAFDMARDIAYQSGILKTHQLAAIKYVLHKAEIESNNCINPLLERFMQLKHSNDDLLAVLKYIRIDAPMIIHVKPESLVSILKDTHYRNGHETKNIYAKHSSNHRKSVEYKLFGKESKYNKCPKNELVKYGVLNIFKSPQGVSVCKQYGDAYFVLSKYVRPRTTMCFGDSLCLVNCDDSSKKFATCEQFVHILNMFSNKQLKKLIAISKNQLEHYESHENIYREVQIHGEIILERDVVEVVAPKHVKDSIQRLCDKLHIKATYL